MNYDEQIDSALATPPDIRPPAEFAARMKSMIPSTPQVRPGLHPGVVFAVFALGAVVLVGPIVVVGVSSVSGAVLLASAISLELAAVVIWLGRWTRV